MTRERIELPGLRVDRLPYGVWVERVEGGLVAANEVCAAMFDEIVRLRAAALNTTPPAATLGAVAAVKALDWREIMIDRGDGSSDHDGSWEAHSGFCTFYEVEMGFASDSYVWSAKFDGVHLKDFDDPEEAKAFAQADYEDRVRQQIAHPTQPEPAEQVAGKVYEMPADVPEEIYGLAAGMTGMSRAVIRAAYRAVAEAATPDMPAATPRQNAAAGVREARNAALEEAATLVFRLLDDESEEVLRAVAAIRGLKDKSSTAGSSEPRPVAWRGRDKDWAPWNLYDLEANARAAKWNFVEPLYAIPLLSAQGDWCWDDKDPDGKPWTYDRADLRLGRIELGSYNRWADESLAREGMDASRPIHAWVKQASFIDGVYTKAPDGWFATAAEARSFVEAEASKMLAEAGALASTPSLPAQGKALSKNQENQGKNQDGSKATPPEADGGGVDAASDVRDALEWYADKVDGCRKLGSIGDPARHDLDADGGKRAREALTALKTTDPAAAARGGEEPNRFEYTRPGFSPYDTPSPTAVAGKTGGA